MTIRIFRLVPVGKGVQRTTNAFVVYPIWGGEGEGARRNSNIITSSVLSTRWWRSQCWSCSRATRVTVAMPPCHSCTKPVSARGRVRRRRGRGGGPSCRIVRQSACSG